MFLQNEGHGSPDIKSRLSFFALMILFLLLILVAPLLPSYYENYFVNIIFSFLLIASTLTLIIHHCFYVTVIIATIFTITLNTMKLFQDTFWFELTSSISSMFMIGAITVVLFNRVFFSKNFKTDLIFGSISVYILLGTLWALCYSLIDLFEPHSFRGMDPLVTDMTVKEHPFRLQPYLYFSFVTQTTLGYGDISPAIPLTHSLAIIQAMMGQFYVAILVAGLVGALVREKILTSK